MIEIDDTKHHDFLSDEARSGFGDDNESFGLGRFGGEKPIEEKNSAGNVAASPLEAIPQMATESELIHQPVQSVEHPTILSGDISSVTDAEPMERLPLEKQTTEISQHPAETTGENSNPPLEQSHLESAENPANQSSEVPTSELPTVIADEPVSVAAANSLALDNSSFAKENDSIIDISSAADVPMDNNDNNIETTPIPPAHEAYIPPVFGNGETILSENASTDGTRKVITIPSAEEQRKEDAEKAAAQATLKTTPLKNAWSRSAIAASVAGVILTTFVASGYMLVRKTSLGSGARNLWATLTGDQSKAVPQDSASVALLDLTKKSQSNSAQQTANNNAPSQTSTPSVNSGQNTVQGSQAMAISQNKQPDSASQNTATGQSIPQSHSNTAISGSAIKNSGSANVGQNTSTLATNTQADKKQQSVQEKASQAPPTTKQPTKPASAPEAKPAATQVPTSTNPTTTKQSATATKEAPASSKPTTSAKPTRPSQSAALERQKTQQISGVFAIQVYASPSIADAEDWVERLKQRGMVNAMVTSQVIRGQTMYRVRFGLYNSLRDAERDAERFGYVGSWVVRLR